MLLTIPVPKTEYLSADEIHGYNEWCARLAQLQLLGAQIEDHTEQVTSRVATSRIIDAVPTPFAEPPKVKCPNCGNTEIKKFSVAYYQRHYNPVMGFNRKGEIAVGDSGDWGTITRKDLKHLDGYFLACHLCDHEHEAPAGICW